MYTQRLRAVGVSDGLRALDRPGEFFQRGQRFVERRGNRGWAITGDAVPREQALDGGEAIGIAFHDIVAGGAVNMNVDEAGREDGVAKIDDASAGGDRHLRARAGGGDDTVFDNEHSIVHALQWREHLPG
jgi:hypothetical protein